MNNFCSISLNFLCGHMIPDDSTWGRIKIVVCLSWTNKEIKRTFFQRKWAKNTLHFTI